MEQGIKELFLRVNKEINNNEIIDDDDAKIISKRQEIYWNQTDPIIDHYKKVNLLKEINGLGSIEEVTQRIIKIIN